MHGLDWYDYGARYYDAVISQFTTIDPLAEKYYSTSPYAYCAGNPVMFVDPDGREIHIYYKDENQKNQRLQYTAGMTYEGTNSFVASSVSFLNSINEAGGDKVLGELITSKNSFNVLNKTPIDKNGKKQENVFLFASLKEGGGNIYAGELMNLKVSGYSKIEALSHELFHALQDEKGQGGASIFNEVEASVYSAVIAMNWMLNSGEFGFNSSNGRGNNLMHGVIYEYVFDKSTNGFSQGNFDILLNNYMKGSAANQSGLYNKYPVRRGNQRSNLLKQYYPTIIK